jgi:hypothetical protein
MFIGDVISTIPKQGENSMSTPQEQVPLDEEFFDPEASLDLDDDEGLDNDPDDSDDGDGFDDSDLKATAEIPFKVPEMPAILFYDSASHGHRRFYQNSLKGKPEWGATKDEAFVFDNADHLKLAGENCKAWGYSGLDIETVK